MITSFKSKALKRLFLKADRSKLPPDMVGKIEEILFVLSTAESLEEIDQPGFRLHGLSGDRAGQYAITVRANWRIVFRFEDGDIYEIDFVDYH